MSSFPAQARSTALTVAEEGSQALPKIRRFGHARLRLIKAARAAALIALATYAIPLVAVVTRQRALLYHPAVHAIEPAAAGLPRAQALNVKTSDGEELVAWHIPATPGRPVILYFQGNGGGLADRAARFDALTAGGLGLLAVSYRGYFGSTGSPTETGLRTDADAAYDEALALGYRADRIIVVGESLGTGVAVGLAARKPVAALVLEAPYTSTAAVAEVSYWMFSVRLLMWDQFHSDRLIGAVHVPLLVLHGERDEVVPIRFGEELFTLANEPKEFVTVPAGHHLVMRLPGVIPQVLHWIEAHVPSP